MTILNVNHRSDHPDYWQQEHRRYRRRRAGCDAPIPEAEAIRLAAAADDHPDLLISRAEFDRRVSELESQIARLVGFIFHKEGNNNAG